MEIHYDHDRFSTDGRAVRQVFPTGAQRDTQDKKSMFHLIPLQVLDALQQSYGGQPFRVDQDAPAIYDVPVDATILPLMPTSVIDRINLHLTEGAARYGKDNWKKGIFLSRTFASLLRHAFQWFAGDTSEDHLAAIGCNLVFLMWTESEISHGNLPAELGDCGSLKNHPDNTRRSWRR